VTGITFLTVLYAIWATTPPPKIDPGRARHVTDAGISGEICVDGRRRDIDARV
jgi:hypothetical protein